MYGERSTRIVSLGGMTVHTNLEAVAIILATGFGGRSLLEGLLIIGSFAFGTGLHLACHLLVAVAFGKGIDRMVLTRAGRIDYSGAPPRFVENLLRTAAGASMNGLCALGSYAALDMLDTTHWPAWLVLAVHTFGRCSLILTVVNFLPAVPLDGGLLLRYVVARFAGEAKAVTVTVAVSAVLLTAMAVFGAVVLQPVLVYMGVTITYDNLTKYFRTHPSERAAHSASFM